MKLEEIIKRLNEEFTKETFKCPICGTKVSYNSYYCLKCKKKVKPKNETESIKK